MTDTLKIENLHVSVEGKPILRGVNLTINRGETHALMGPNGSGKSTLANVVMGHPALEVTQGSIHFKGEDITEADPEERSRMGLFMAFQYPVAIPGVTVAKYIPDFVYLDNKTGREVIEDVKSPITKRESTYRLKFKIMAAMGLHVVEV